MLCIFIPWSFGVFEFYTPKFFPFLFIQKWTKFILWLRLSLDCAFGIWCLHFFFFFHVFVRLQLLFMYCSMNSNCKVLLFYFFSQLVHIVHYSWTHKFHFSATFSLKIGPTILFTHLKIILLQYFSIFNFSFQFSTVSKRTLSVTLFKILFEGMIKAWC